MGYGHYSLEDRTVRSFSKGYSTKSVDEIFTQNRERKMHEDMNPHGVVNRICSDSEAHPNVTPIQLYLDVTGSMGHIPHQLIKDGLPTLMGTLIQNGVQDATLMFGAVGDHECDRCPLQIGQFESGDAELDMWLTRTYLEGGGGGNSGESYPLAWYFAANHVHTDAFEKRGKKGFVFTIGDEPFLKNVPVSALKGIMGDTAVGQGNYTAQELLAAAQKKNHVYHIFLEHGSRRCNSEWKQLLGNNLIIIDDYTQVSKTISEIVLSHQSSRIVSVSVSTPNVDSNETSKPEIDSDIIL